MPVESETLTLTVEDLVSCRLGAELGMTVRGAGRKCSWHQLSRAELEPVWTAMICLPGRLINRLTLSPLA